MKKIIFLAFAVAIAVAMSACNEEQEPPKVEPIPEPEEEIDPTISETDRNWVYEYNPQTHKSPTSSFIVNEIRKIDCFYISFTPITQDPWGDHWFPVSTKMLPVEDHQWLEYNWRADSLIMSFSANSYRHVHPNGDWSWAESQKPTLHELQPGEPVYKDYYWDYSRYITNPTKYINIVCSDDYDEQHPKGTLLNDITNISYYTARPFVDSRYQNRRLGDREKSYTKEQPLTEFNTKNIDLLDDGMVMRLLVRPLKSQIYTFTFTYCDNTDKPVSFTTLPIFLVARKPL